MLCCLGDDGEEGDDGEVDYPETWAFLERRIDDVLKTFGLPRRLKERMAGVRTPFRRRRRRVA